MLGSLLSPMGGRRRAPIIRRLEITSVLYERKIGVARQTSQKISIGFLLPTLPEINIDRFQEIYVKVSKICIPNLEWKYLSTCRGFQF